MKVWDRAGIELATPGTAVRHKSADMIRTALHGQVRGDEEKGIRKDRCSSLSVH